jgi:hypothetical protein
MAARTRTTCVLLGLGCAMLLLLQHQLLTRSAGMADSAMLVSRAVLSGAYGPRAAAGGAAGGGALVRTADAYASDGGRAPGLPAEHGRHAAPLTTPAEDDAAAAALGARAAAALAAAAAANAVSAAPDPTAALGGDVFDEPVLLREAEQLALRRADGRRELILVPTSQSCGAPPLPPRATARRLLPCSRARLASACVDLAFAAAAAAAGTYAHAQLRSLHAQPAAQL